MSRTTDQPLTVTEVAGRIRGALEAGLPGKLRVVGEISNLSNRSHWFFSLKDGGAALRCVMFASAARRVAFAAKDGLEVVATGRIDFYDAQGNVQLYVDKLEPVGQGALELELRRLMAELRELGYFELDRKKPLPAVPRKVAVVTSVGGAALQDVIDTARRRWPGCELVLIDVRVQGADAAPQVSRALRKLSQRGKAWGIDAVILTRGGGSIEDLWAFNERDVADALFKCKLPVVAAIGHETDTTIAELVADVRCATPTQAAMTVVPDAAALSEQVTQLQRRLSLGLRRRVEYARQRVDSAARHRLLARPEQLVRDADAELKRVAARLRPAVTRRLNDARTTLASTARHLDAVAPQRVLERGFTYTTDADGRVLRQSGQATQAGSIVTVFPDGRVASVVVGAASDPTDQPATPNSAHPTSSPASRSPHPRKKTRRRGKTSGGGPSLFER